MIHIDHKISYLTLSCIDYYGCPHCVNVKSYKQMERFDIKLDEKNDTLKLINLGGVRCHVSVSQT